jgi:hypothetical protein
MIHPNRRRPQDLAVLAPWKSQESQPASMPPFEVFLNIPPRDIPRHPHDLPVIREWKNPRIAAEEGPKIFSIARAVGFLPDFEFSESNPKISGS